jgi:hypothetical protein
VPIIKRPASAQTTPATVRSHCFVTLVVDGQRQAGQPPKSVALIFAYGLISIKANNGNNAKWRALNIQGTSEMDRVSHRTCTSLVHHA